MVINSREARKQAERKIKKYKSKYIERWMTLFNNSVKLVNAEDDVPKRYFLRQLYEKGGVAYDIETRLYLPYTGVGIDVYGFPTMYTLIAENGYTIQREPNQVVIIRANDQAIPLRPYFDMQANKVAFIDMAIEQNIEACKYMTIAEVEDESQLLSVTNEMEARAIGATIVYKNKSASVGMTLNCQSTGATYLADKLLEARKEILNETLSTIGISVANTDKKERVQSMEVMASRGYAIDCINTMIDTVNYDCEQGGLNLRIEANTSLIKQVELEYKQMEYDNESGRDNNQTM